MTRASPSARKPIWIVIDEVDHLRERILYKLMAAEIIVTIATGMGLGHVLNSGRQHRAMEQVVGVMLVIVAVGLLVDRILFLPAERWLRRRWGIEART